MIEKLWLFRGNKNLFHKHLSACVSFNDECAKKISSYWRVVFKNTHTHTHTVANYLMHEVLQKAHCFLLHDPRPLCTCWKLVKFLLNCVKGARAFWQQHTPLINVKMHAFIGRIIPLYPPFHVGLGRVIQESFNLQPGSLVLKRAMGIAWRETEGAALSLQ